MALASALLAACTHSPTPPPLDLRILWTDDTHGYLSPRYHRLRKAMTAFSSARGTRAASAGSPPMFTTWRRVI
jgi:hypothetical protein